MSKPIWTEEENADRQVENMMSPSGKSCKNCIWSNYHKGDEFITCGHHYDNFTTDSLCSYWTDSDDPKVLAHYTEIKSELKARLGLQPDSGRKTILQ